MPAWRWPGTEQKNLYVPGLRFTERLFEPPENVGVAPTFSPDDDSIVTLCGSDEEFVKSTDTLPAFADSDFVLYSSWPSGFASSFTLLEPPDVAGAGVDVLAELVVGVVSAGVLVLAAVEEELDEELPQPASASSATSNASIEMVAFERLVVRPAAGSLTSDPPLVGVVGSYDTARRRSFPGLLRPAGVTVAVEHTPADPA
jgi:hypothetical protein